jgi:hypothetical protein
MGRNLPQEAPQAFAQAIVDVAEVCSTLACIPKPRSVHETDLDLGVRSPSARRRVFLQMAQ